MFFIQRRTAAEVLMAGGFAGAAGVLASAAQTVSRRAQNFRKPDVMEADVDKNLWRSLWPGGHPCRVETGLDPFGSERKLQEASG
jgi:hypothetical protein